MTARTGAGEAVRFIAAAMRAAGLAERDAEEVGRLMVAADLAGFDGHGIIRLPGYVARLKAGGVNPRPRIRIVRDAPSTAVVDGDDGMGHLVVAYAARVALGKAAETGIGWVGTRNSNHAGAASVYAAMALERDMIGLYAAVGSGNHLPPWGGLDRLLSTNPIAVAIPSADGPPVVMDFATTVASMGKIKTLAQRGEEMPAGWMVGRDGRALTDPKRADEGLLLPMGGYKGYALGLVIGLLAGTLNDAAMGRSVVDFNKHPEAATNTGQFVCAIDPARFGETGAFKDRVGEVARSMRGSAVMPGFESVRVPGDGRAARQAERARGGVPIPPALRAGLDALAGELGIDRLG